jgi:glutamine synthetase
VVDTIHRKEETASDALEQTKQRLIERGVRYCLGSYVDVHGSVKAKIVPIEAFVRMVNGSELYTVGALDGMGDLGPEEDETSAHPDLASLTIMPWNRACCWMASDLHWHGKGYPMCSRGVLKRQTEEARARGFVFNLGIEPEFFVYRRMDGRYEPLDPDDKLIMPGYDVRSALRSMDFLDPMVRYMTELEWGVFSFDHEGGRGQFEFDFQFADALTMADRFIFLRLMIGEVAKSIGAVATFMPKPFSDDFGSGAHFNMSLAHVDGGENLFWNAKERYGLQYSDLAFQFAAGVLEHAAAISAVACPTPNSYKRLISRGTMADITWAPVYVAYGDNNRSCMLRLPRNRCVVESRAPDAATNPYLSAALTMAAGLEGIERQLDPGAPIFDNLYTLGDGELERRGIRRLPRTLLEALDAFDADPLVERTFGPKLKAAYLKQKSLEWQRFHDQVTDWEREQLLDFL